MTDNLTHENRIKNMRAIRSIHTKLEDKVCKELWKRGYRFRRNVSGLFGKPDIAIRKYKVVVFIDSCFWHGCELHGNTPKSNQEYWIPKLKRNKERDNEVTFYYTSREWSILRLWEHQLKKASFEDTLYKLCHFINQVKSAL
jgi:DNA mismatch endonuclease (patch repair protein)